MFEHRRAGACAAAVWLAAGLLAGCTNKSESPTQPSPTPTTDATAYTALGASDAVGVGASVPCLPFAACPDGTGYVPVIARRLSESSTVTTTNLGIPAAVLSPEVQELGNRYGRNIPANFLQGEMPFVPRNTTLVTIFAGGNDTNAIGTAIEGGSAGNTDVRVYIDGQVTQLRTSLDTLVRGIRQRSPSTRIVIANLPNFAGLPFTQGYSLQRRQALQRISVGLSRDAINILTVQNVSVVDLLCDPRSYDPAHYSSDGFHPNDRGYAFIADAFLTAIRSTSVTEGQPTCAQTVLVPPL
jgi:lysophospholipase L1-like esterase